MGKGNFINYVVNNDSNKYPSDGLHTDGYYYEKVSEGAKVASGTITLPSQTLSITIEHGLGKIPTKFILLSTKMTKPNTTYNPALCAGFDLNKNKWVSISYSASKIYETEVYAKNTDSLIIPTIDDTNIIFPSGMYRIYESDYSNYGMYYLGEYKWIAIAE